MEKFFHKFLTILCRWALIIVIFVGCGKDKPAEPIYTDDPNLEDWDFLKVGNWWEWEEEVFDEEMKLEDKSIWTNEITLIDGNYIYYDDYYPGSIYGGNKEYMDDTFWGMDEYSPYVFKDSYVGRKDKINYSFIILEVLSINEPVTVPAGTFRCIKTKCYVPYNDEVVWYSYYSKRHGLIMERYEYGDGSSKTRILKSYNIK